MNMVVKMRAELEKNKHRNGFTEDVWPAIERQLLIQAEEQCNICHEMAHNSGTCPYNLGMYYKLIPYPDAAACWKTNKKCHTLDKEAAMMAIDQDCKEEKFNMKSQLLLRKTRAKADAASKFNKPKVASKSIHKS